MNELSSAILQIEVEAVWQPPELEGEDSGERHFKRYLTEVLQTLQRLSGADAGHVAITGLECGVYKPVVSLHGNLEDIPATPTSGGTSLTARRLEGLETFHVLSPPGGASSDPEFSRISQRVLLHFVGHGELFGFLCLDCHPPKKFSHHVLGMLRESASLLTTLVAEQNFSMRVGQLAGSFRAVENAQHLSPLYHEILDRTTHGLGADGAVLRLFYPDLDPPLVVEAAHGDLPADLLRDQSPGQGISGKLIVAPEAAWIVVVDGAVRASSGVGPVDGDLQRLRQAGITSFIAMRLDTDVKDSEEERTIGTLSYFVRRPHIFSWRDVALFRSFCERVADTIALHRQTAKLMESHENLRRQSMMITQVEIASLLAHDLFHKSFNTCQALDQFIHRAKRALSEDQPRASQALDDEADRAMNSAMAVQQALQQLRSLQNYNLEEFEKRTAFDLVDVVNDIEKTLAGALARNNITIRRQFPGKLPVVGPREVLAQVLFNLVINSIDAAKARRTRRPMAITIQARLDPPGTTQRRLTVIFWDEGPGIDRATFRDPREIFQIGRTTKANGTGTGLPVARILLTKYFQGSLDLDDPETARFKLTIAVAPP